LLRPPLLHLIPNTSMVLLSMPPSPTRPTKRDISALSRLSILLSTSRPRRALVMLLTTPPSSSMPRDSKIFPLSPASVTSSVSTELPSASTTARDSSMPTFSTIAHGLPSLVTPMRMLLSVTLESTPHSTRARQLFLPTSASGPQATSASTT